jgi:hypothetical protein
VEAVQGSPPHLFTAARKLKSYKGPTVHSAVLKPLLPHN